MSKPTHAKPSLYAFYFEQLKDIAYRYGYNLVLHGSMNRDLDLVAIPWQQQIGDHDRMIEDFAVFLGGSIMQADYESKYCFPHGRMSYVIDINRGGYTPADNEDGYIYTPDPQYYLDISVIPVPINSNIGD
jgi:hypothetical protein